MPRLHVLDPPEERVLAYAASRGRGGQALHRRVAAREGALHGEDGLLGDVGIVEQVQQLLVGQRQAQGLLGGLGSRVVFGVRRLRGDEEVREVPEHLDAQLGGHGPREALADAEEQAVGALRRGGALRRAAALQHGEGLPRAAEDHLVQVTLVDLPGVAGHQSQLHAAAERREAGRQLGRRQRDAYIINVVLCMMY